MISDSISTGCRCVVHAKVNCGLNQNALTERRENEEIWNHILFGTQFKHNFLQKYMTFSMNLLDQFSIVKSLGLSRWWARATGVSRGGWRVAHAIVERVPDPLVPQRVKCGGKQFLVPVEVEGLESRGKIGWLETAVIILRQNRSRASYSYLL